MPPPRRLPPLLDLGFIVVAAVVAFHNVFPNSFHLDDFYRIAGNPGIQQVHPIWRHFVDPSTLATLPRLADYRPLLPLTLSLNYWWAGESVAGYHAVNLAFHVASSLLLYTLLRQLAARRAAALVAALLFAVHPLAGIVVNYVSARDLAMMNAFLLGSLVCYTGMRARGRDSVAGWSVSLALAAMAILSKTNALALPALIAAYELLVARVPWRSRGPWLRAAAFAVVPALFFLWTSVMLRFSDLPFVLSDDPGGAPAYVLAQTKVHLVYLFNVVWPANMRLMPLVVPPAQWFDPAVAAMLLVLAGSLAVAWRIRTTQPVVAFCVIAYWVLMALECSVFPLYHLRADYRPYPASAFLFGAVAVAAVTWLPRAALAIGGGLAIGALTFASIQINRTWRSEESLWTHSVDLGGDTVAYQSLAAAIADRRDPRVKALLERAVLMAPRNILAHVNYGLHLIERGQQDEGLAHVRQGVVLAPDLAQSHHWLAVAYEAVKMPGPAVDEALTAAELDPHNMEYAYEAARLAQNTGRIAESLAPLRKVLAWNERYLEAKFFDGFALQKTGALDQAIVAYRTFLGWQPQHVQARFNLAYALLTKGDCTAAIPEFRQTLMVKSDYREAHLYLAICYDAAGDLTQAATERRLLEGKDQD